MERIYNLTTYASGNITRSSSERRNITLDRKLNVYKLHMENKHIEEGKIL